MGYDIYIGNITMRPLEDDEETTEYSRVINGKVQYYKPVVEGMKHPDAPTFPNDEMTGNGNSRHPGYAGWAEFCRRTGLYALFFDKTDGLMREHPGCTQLDSEHYRLIRAALDKWRYSHPDARPGFEEYSWERQIEPVGYDGILARLIWLEWWVKWALDNCEHAGICNW